MNRTHADADIMPALDIHREAIIDLFLQTHNATQGAYPPKGSFTSTEHLAENIFCPPEAQRWVAVTQDQVVGHISTNPLQAEQHELYWKQALPGVPEQEYVSYRLISKLVISPSWQRQGIGRRLLRHARRELQAGGRLPVLLVLEELAGARALYEQEGGKVLSRFTGITGKPLLSMIFPTPPETEVFRD